MPKVTITPEEEPEEEVVPVEETVTDQSIAVEDLDPDLPLWENGPSASQAVIWKEKYGDVYVTSVTADYHVAWRTINRAEFKTVVKQIEQLVSSGTVSQAEAEMVNEELVCQICALFPVFSQKDFAGNLAGLPSILSQQILSASGFTSIDVVQL
jgi:hypothetical protein